MRGQPAAASLQARPWLAIAYLALVRTTPQLVQLYILYFLLGPMLGLAPLPAPC